MTTGEGVRVFPKVVMKSRKRFVRSLRLKMVVYLLGGGAALLLPAVAAAASPERIVSLAPNLTEILFDLGIGNRIAAVTDYCDYPPGARSKPKVGGFVNPSLEAIVSRRPDWVVMTEDGNPRVLERRLGALGIRTYIFRARRIDDLPREIRTMGRIFGVGTAADRRADQIEMRIRRIRESSKTASRGKVKRALFIFQPVPLIAAGKGTTVDDAFAILGMVNIAAAGPTRYPKYSLEEIIRLGPDALFFGKGRGMEERIRPLMEKLATLDAVRSGRVFFVGDAIYRLGPRIASSLEEMAACLHVR
ncbi:MAG: ABC transporter substrate-binding protein [Deltaproteobacteria bacterium]|nr:ABC transporter substrate-binding protein [Deltaproteobacteria bacterium]